MLLGLTGFAGVGKDTAAAHLVEHHGFTRFAFADKLRELTYAMNPAIPEGFEYGGPTSLAALVDEIGWDLAKRRYASVREVLQNVGMAHRQVIGEDFWLRQVFDQIRAARTDAGRFIITDVRFPNEARAVRSWFDTDDRGIVVRIERMGTGPANSHISEEPLVPDYTVRNFDDMPEEMFKRLDEVVGFISNGRMHQWQLDSFR